MGVIHMLDIGVANLIAAGEVVDRPASVAKELLENAIDAGADAITLEIRNGGISMIRVTDNGCGMGKEDLPVALKRHATSKIRTAEDLSRITTLGFRGEALAAIASVSDVHIISKRREDECGHVLTATDGRILDIEEVGCTDGTVVLIENLFARIPARRKFLKKDATEAQAIAAVAEKVAMSHPEISFTFINQGQTKFKTPGDGHLLHALHALLGKDIASRLIAVKGESLGVRVDGYIGRSDAARVNRNQQNFFLNGRFIKSRTMMAALERAFVSYIAPERFPIAFLFVTIDPSSVDVNVHPTKLEIKFSDEKPVFEAVYYTVRAALEDNTDRPTLDLSAESPSNMGSEPLTPVEQIKISASEVESETAHSIRPHSVELSPEQSLHILQMVSNFEKKQNFSVSQFSEKQQFASPVPSPDNLPDTLTPSKEEPHRIEEANASEGHIPPYHYLGTLFRCYILLEIGENRNECLVIDQHAAHERILFEEMKKNRSSACAAQELLVPLTVHLTPEEFAAACEHQDLFASVGIIFRPTQKDCSLILSAIPNAVSPYDAEPLVVSMANDLAINAGNPSLTVDILSEKALYQIACKAAIKGGRTYNDEDIDWLCRQVLRMPDITVCPHGRPIAFTLSKSDLDRRFQRI